MDEVNTYAGADAYIRIYDGTRPANEGAATTLLAELRGNAGGFGTVTAGVLEASAITSDASADASGTATWFRVLASDGTTIVMDGSVSTVAAGTGDLQLDSTTITATQTVAIDTFVITEGNDY